MQIDLAYDPTNNALRTIAGLSLPRFDYVSLAQTATTDTYVFKTGGSGGLTVATVVIVWTDASKTVLVDVTKS